MFFLAPILDNDDPLFALVITPGFYLHHVEVADQDLANGSHYRRTKVLLDRTGTGLD